MADENLKDDLLKGCKAIADYVGQTERQTYYLLEAGRLPGFKLGGKTWHSRKSTLRQHIERLEHGGEAA